MSLTRFFGIKIISSILVLTFAVTDIAFSQGAMIPQALPLMQPLKEISLQENYVNVVDSFEKKSPIHVDIVQDFHCNFSTQESIYQYLEAKFKKGEIDGIYQEGASGDVDTSFWHALEEPVRDQVSFSLMQQGLLGGSELFSIKHPSVSFQGAEQAEFYTIHRQAFNELVYKQVKAKESFGEVNQILTSLKMALYPSQLILLEKNWNQSQGRGDLISFLKQYTKEIEKLDLSSLSPEFKQFLSLTESASRYSYQAFQNDITVLSQDLMLSSKIKIELKDWIKKDYKEKKLSDVEQVTMFLSKVSEEKYPALFYALMLDLAFLSISSDTINRNMIQLYELLKKPYMTESVIKRLSRLNDYVKLLKKIWFLEITPTEFEKYQSLDSRIDFNQELIYMFSKADNRLSLRTEDRKGFFVYDSRNVPEAFYGIAKKRDKAIFETVSSMINKKGEGNYVLVVGGFHGEELAQMFKEEKISYQLLSPKFEHIDENIHDKYMRAMGSLEWVEGLDEILTAYQSLNPQVFSGRPNAAKAVELLAMSFSKEEKRFNFAGNKFKVSPKRDDLGRAELQLLPLDGGKVIEFSLDPFSSRISSVVNQAASLGDARGVKSFSKAFPFLLTGFLGLGVILTVGVSEVQAQGVETITEIKTQEEFSRILGLLNSATNSRVKADYLRQLLNAEVDSTFKVEQLRGLHSRYRENATLRTAIAIYFARHNQGNLLGEETTAPVSQSVSLSGNDPEYTVTKEVAVPQNPIWMILAGLLGVLGVLLGVLARFPMSRSIKIDSQSFNDGDSINVPKGSLLEVQSSSGESIDLEGSQSYFSGETIFYQGKRPEDKNVIDLKERDISTDILPSSLHLRVVWEEDDSLTVYGRSPVRYWFQTNAGVQYSPQSPFNGVLKLKEFQKQATVRAAFIQISEELVVKVSQAGELNFHRLTQFQEGNVVQPVLEEISSVRTVTINKAIESGMVLRVGPSKFQEFIDGKEEYKELFNVTSYNGGHKVSALDSEVSDWTADLKWKIEQYLPGTVLVKGVVSGILVILAAVFGFVSLKPNKETLKFTIPARSLRVEGNVELPRPVPLNYSLLQRILLPHVEERAREGVVARVVPAGAGAPPADLSASDFSFPYEFSRAVTTYSQPILAPISGVLSRVGGVYVIKSPEQIRLESEKLRLEGELGPERVRWTRVSEAMGEANPDITVSVKSEREVEIETRLAVIGARLSTLVSLGTVSFERGGETRFTASVDAMVQSQQVIGQNRFLSQKQISLEIPAALALLLVNKLAVVQKQDGTVVQGVSIRIDGVGSKPGTTLVSISRIPSTAVTEESFSGKIVSVQGDSRVQLKPEGEFDYFKGALSSNSSIQEAAEFSGPIVFTEQARTVGERIRSGAVIGRKVGDLIDGQFRSEGQINANIRQLREDIRSAQEKLGEIRELAREIEGLRSDRSRQQVVVSTTQETEDRRLVNSSQSFRTLLGKITEAKTFGLTDVLTHFQSLLTPLRALSGNLHDHGIVKNALEQLISQVDIVYQAGNRGETPDLSLLERLYQLVRTADITGAPASPRTQTQVVAEQRRIDGEIGSRNQTTRRLKVQIRSLLRLARDAEIDSDTVEGGIRAVEQMIATRRSVIAGLNVRSSQGGVISVGAPSGQVSVTQDQVVYQLSGGSSFSVSLASEQASNLSVGDSLYVRIGDVYVRGEISHKLSDGNVRGQSRVLVVLSLPGIQSLSTGGDVEAVVLVSKASSLGKRRFGFGLLSLSLLTVVCLTSCKVRDIVENERGRSQISDRYGTASSIQNVTLTMGDDGKIRVVGVPMQISGAAVTEHDLPLLLLRRNYNVINADVARQDSETSSKSINDFNISTFFGGTVSRDGETYEVAGGFIIQLPAYLGGGTINLTIGESPVASGIDTLMSFTMSLKSLFTGVGADWSDLAFIVQRAGANTYQQQLVSSVDRVNSEVLKLWYMRQQQTLVRGQLGTLRSELAYLDRVLPSALDRDKASMRTRRSAILSQIATLELLVGREGASENGTLGARIRLSEVAIRRALNVSADPSMRINFTLDTANVNTVSIQGLPADGNERRLKLNQLFRQLALLDMRVSSKVDDFEATGIRLVLEEAGNTLPDIRMEGHRGDPELFQSRLDDFRTTSDTDPDEFGGAVLVPNLFNFLDDGSSARSKLQGKNRVIENMVGKVVEEIQTAWINLGQKQEALLIRKAELDRKEAELASLRSGSASSTNVLLQDFQKQREISLARANYYLAYIQYRSAVSAFMSFAPDRALLQSISDFNLDNEEMTEEQEAFLNRYGRENIRRLKPVATILLKTVAQGGFNIQTSRVTVQSLVTARARARSLGSVLAEEVLPTFELPLEIDESFVSDVVRNNTALIQGLFQTLKPEIRDEAFKSFKLELESRVEVLSAFVPLTDSDPQVRLLLTEEDLSENVEFLNKITEETFLGIFVKSESYEAAVEKIASYFPEGLPETVAIYPYATSNSLYQEVNTLISREASLGEQVVSVIVSPDKGLFRKLTKSTENEFLHVSVESDVPAELSMELSRRIGAVRGETASLIHDDMSLMIQYDARRGLFTLLSLTELIEGLFNDIKAQYQIQIAA